MKILGYHSIELILTFIVIPHVIYLDSLFMVMEFCFIESQIFILKPGQKLTKQVFLTSRVYSIDFMLLTGVSVSNITSSEGRLANTKGGVIGQCPEFV